MDSASIKTAILKYHEETWNKGNYDYVDKFLAPNYVGIDMSTGKTDGRDDYKQRPPFTNLHIDLTDITVEGDRAAFRWAASGNNAEGKLVKVVGISMYIFEDGMVVKGFSLNAMLPTE